MAKKKEEIKFTSLERRVLQIPQGEKQYGKQAVALRKIIDLFPWLLVAADNKYDQGVCDTLVWREGSKVYADSLVEQAIKKSREKKL